MTNDEIISEVRKVKAISPDHVHATAYFTKSGKVIVKSEMTYVDMDEFSKEWKIRDETDDPEDDALDLSEDMFNCIKKSDKSINCTLYILDDGSVSINDYFGNSLNTYKNLEEAKKEWIIF